MYSFNARVRYSEGGGDRRLSVPGVVNYLQDCSTFQSEDLKMGIDYLEQSHRAWWLSSWQIVINRYPRLGEEIVVSTWPYDFKGIYGYRNFTICDKQGEYLVKANSIWVFYDWNKSRPAKITEDIEQSYGREPKLEMNYAERKIAVPEGGVAEEPFPIRRHQIDTNGHVNNGQYIQMAQEYVPHVSEIRSLRAEYRKSAVYGNSIYPVAASVEDGWVISLNDEERKPYAVIAFSRK